MAVTDLADVAAAQSAGYRLLQNDRGPSSGAPNLSASQPPRFQSTLEKWLLGGAGDSGFMLRAYGESNASAAAADAAAVSALNDIRQQRYGGAGGRASGDAESANAKGATLQVDVN